MRGRGLARRAAAVPRDALVGLRTRGWPERSRLFVIGDSVNWALDGEARHLVEVAGRLGIAVGEPSAARGARRQALFHTSHFGVWSWVGTSHRLGVSYFHGRPGTPGYPEFDEAYASLRRHAARVDRVQVTHAEMHELVLEAGVAPERVFRIPIGIDLERFPLRGPGDRRTAREALGLPQDAFLVGSFQKDGVGWGDGDEPKTIKGPDLLVSTAAAARRRVPELHVLLTGPARGFVKRGLTAVGVPYSHLALEEREGLSLAFQALDAYLVPARQEGGPKGPLEAMASGVPVVTTRVGEIQELIDDGREGFLADVDDGEALVERLVAIADGAATDELVAAARSRVETVAHGALDGAWAELLEGFVERSHGG